MSNYAKKSLIGITYIGHLFMTPTESCMELNALRSLKYLHVAITKKGKSYYQKSIYTASLLMPADLTKSYWPIT